MNTRSPMTKPSAIVRAMGRDRFDLAVTGIDVGKAWGLLVGLTTVGIKLRRAGGSCSRLITTSSPRSFDGGWPRHRAAASMVVWDPVGSKEQKAPFTKKGNGFEIEIDPPPRTVTGKGYSECAPAWKTHLGRG